MGRFILILVIVWSLIIRTCYQSMLYEFLQTDMRKPAVTTFRDLRERNFTFYGRLNTTFDVDSDLPEAIKG